MLVRPDRGNAHRIRRDVVERSDLQSEFLAERRERTPLPRRMNALIVPSSLD
jgi:hypothetical protein